MVLSADDEREKKINDALADYRGGDSSIRNLALKYSLPRSTLRDRIKRANITKDVLSPQARRAAMLKNRAKAISEKQTKNSKLRERETVIQEALDYYITDAGGKEGLRSVAANFGIPRSTLRGRILGSIGSKNRIQKGQKLSSAEEDVIVSCILDLCKAGEEVTSSRVRNMANILQQYRVPTPESTGSLISATEMPQTTDPQTGKVNQVCLGWVRGFLGRHTQLIDANGRILDAERIKYLTRTLFDDWFVQFEQKIVHQNVSTDDIYNFDFTYFQIAQLITDGHRQVVSSDSLPDEFVTSPQPESFGVLECCSASGQALDPFVVFRSNSDYFDLATIKNFQEVAGWSFNHTSDGVVDEDLILNWFHRWFDQKSSERLKHPSDKRVLIGDWSIMKTSNLFEEACSSRNVELLSIPDGTAHELQPLDIGLFTKMKRNFCMEAELFLKTAEEHGEHQPKFIPADELISCFYFARKHGMAKTNIQKAFKLAGLLPYDPISVITRIWDPVSTRNIPYDYIIADSSSPAEAAASTTGSAPSSSESEVIVETEEYPSYSYPSQPQTSSIHLLNNPNSVFDIADLVNRDYEDVQTEHVPVSSASSFNSMPSNSSSSSSINFTEKTVLGIENSGYRNIAISALLFSSPSSPDHSTSEFLSHPTTLPILKDIQLDPNYASCSSFNICPNPRPVAQNNPLPSLPDALSTTPRASVPFHSFVEIAPLQSHSLQQLHTSHAVPLPSLTSSMINNGSSQLQPQIQQHFPVRSSKPIVTNTSSLDYICNRNSPGIP